MHKECKSCKSSYYFDESKITSTGMSFRCPKCGDRVLFAGSIANENMGSSESYHKSLFELLPGVFTFPFKGNGRILLVAGTLFLGIISFFQRYNIIPIIGPTLSVLLGGYFCSYLMKIINHSSDGEAELPDFPDFIDWWDSVITPGALIVGTIIFCSIPATVYYFLMKPSRSLTDPIFLLLVGFDLFYLPMGIIAVSMTESLSALNPVFILPSIFKVLDKYIIVVAFLIMIFVSNFVVNKYLESIPVISDFLTAFLSLYFLTIEGRMLGLIYYVNRERLNWFGEVPS